MDAETPKPELNESNPLDCVKVHLTTLLSGMAEMHQSDAHFNRANLEQLAQIMSTDQGFADTISFIMSLVVSFPAVAAIWNPVALRILETRARLEMARADNLLNMKPASKMVN